MSFVRLQYILITGWFTALLIGWGLTALLDGPSPFNLTLAVLACIPPAVLLVVHRGAAPPDAVAAVLYGDGRGVVIAPVAREAARTTRRDGRA